MPDILLNKYQDDIDNAFHKVLATKGITHQELSRWRKKYPIIVPHDRDYNSARLSYNRSIQYFPLMICYVRRTKDITFYLTIAQRYKIPFSLRSGAHDMLGFSSSCGMIIDMSKYNRISYDPLTQVAKVQAGARNGQIASYLSPKGRAIPAGTCQNVAIAGLALGGGVGFLSRKYGLTLDNVVALRVVLADGTSVKVDKDHYPDLYWGLRGGGHCSLGVVTTFYIKTHPIENVILFEVSFEEKHLLEVFDRWQKWAPKVHENFTIDFCGDYTSEIPVVAISGEVLEPPGPDGHIPLETVRKEFAFLADLNPKIRVWEDSFVNAVRYFARPDPDPFYLSLSAFITKELPAPALQIMKKYLEMDRGRVYANPFGGKIKEIPEGDTAFAWRDTLLWFEMNISWKDPEEKEMKIRWINGFYGEMLPYLVNEETGVPRVYTNFKQRNLEEKYQLAYWGPRNYLRLQEIKRRYDPLGVFKHPQGVVVKG